MTDDETVSNEASGQTTHGTSRVKAIVEWFWLGRRLAERRAAFREPGTRALLLAQRAQQSADLARELALAAESAEAPPKGNASELYRQAAYWAACAIASNDGATVHSHYDNSTWDSVEEALLQRAVERPERVEALQSALREGSFVYFAELPDAEQLLALNELRKLSELLTYKFYERSRALQELHLKRAWRLALPVLILAALLVGLSALGDTRDLARGKPWRASSRWAGNSGCESPAQQCAESPDFFFSTNEEKDPWIVFDLGAPHSVSVVKIDNRQDCCVERGFPLSVELSTDQKHWKTVARRDQEFTHWTASFDATEARWVRLRLHKVANFHLERVKILP